MSQLIDWGTTGEIFVESLAAGVVVVGAFALGARLLSVGQAHRTVGRPVTSAFAVATLCFLIAAAAVGFGVYFTVDK